MQGLKESYQTNIKYKKIYSKDLKGMEKTIKMYFKVYLDQ